MQIASSGAVEGCNVCNGSTTTGRVRRSARDRQAKGDGTGRRSQRKQTGWTSEQLEHRVKRHFGMATARVH
jgi:hypothetical protein